MSYDCFSLENLTMDLTKYVTITLHSLVTSNLRHLDEVSAKTGLRPYGLDPVFVLKSMATRWCPLESTKCRSDEISVQFTNL